MGDYLPIISVDRQQGLSKAPRENRAGSSHLGTQPHCVLPVFALDREGSLALSGLVLALIRKFAMSNAPNCRPALHPRGSYCNAGLSIL